MENGIGVVTEADLRFKMVAHMALDHEHISQYRDDIYPVNLEVVVCTWWKDKRPATKRYYYLDDTKRGKACETIGPILDEINRRNRTFRLKCKYHSLLLIVGGKECNGGE